MKNKLYLILIFIFLIIMRADISVFAHKVNIFAYVKGEEIYTESYFNDGKKCIDSKIEVFDSQGNKLLEGVTDQEGMFSFEVPSEGLINGDLKLILSASLGHRAEYIIKANELRNIPELSEQKSENSTPVVSPEISSFSLKEIQSLIENILDEKLKPIMREVVKSQKDKILPTEIIGGIGYIVGIFGIIAYFLSCKK